jgi:hypothetical protein
VSRASFGSNTALDKARLTIRFAARSGRSMATANDYVHTMDLECAETSLHSRDMKRLDNLPTRHRLMICVCPPLTL